MIENQLKELIEINTQILEATVATLEALQENSAPTSEKKTTSTPAKKTVSTRRKKPEPEIEEEIEEEVEEIEEEEVEAPVKKPRAKRASKKVASKKTAAKEETTVTVTKTAVRAKCAEVASILGKAAVVDALADMDAEKVSDIDEEQYPELMETLLQLLADDE